MNKNKLSWCMKQKNGIELIEPNDDLCSAYLADADESLSAMDKNTGKWKIITAYYACYNALYAILMKAGIKCEIHDCTLELAGLFDFTKEEIVFVKNLKTERVDVQYYLKPAQEFNFKKVKLFVSHCRLLSRQITEDKIKEARNQVKND